MENEKVDTCCRVCGLPKDSQYKQAPRWEDRQIKCTWAWKYGRDIELRQSEYNCVHCAHRDCDSGSCEEYHNKQKVAVT